MLKYPVFLLTFIAIFLCLWALLCPCNILRFLRNSWVSWCPPTRYLSLLTLIQRLTISLQFCAVKELLYTGLSSHSSSPLSVLPKQPLTHPWPQLQLWATSHHVSALTQSFLAHCRLIDREEAGCRLTLFFHVISLWAINLLCWFLVVFPYPVVISIVVHCFLPCCRLENSIVWCYWAEGRVFWGMTVKKTVNQTQKHKY